MHTQVYLPAYVTQACMNANTETHQYMHAHNHTYSHITEELP